jgi:CRP-like cAMP-binding protein
MQSDPENVSRGDRMLALRACSGFDTLGAQELWRAAGMLRQRVFREGEELAPIGMPLSSMELVITGRCDLTEPNGETRTLRPPDALGSLAELLDEVKAPRVVARERTVTLGFDRAELEDLMEDDFGVFLGLLRGLASHVARRGGDASGSGTSAKALPQSQHGGALDLVDLILLLKKQTYFARAELAALAALAQQADRLVFPSGSELLAAGGVPDRFLILTSGSAVTESRARSARAGAGDQLGMPEALAGVPLDFTAVADDPVAALGCSADALVDLVEDYPSLGLCLLRTLAHQARG